MYNESEVIDHFFEAVTPILNLLPDWEIICVDDGSTDDTLHRLYEISEKEERIKVIALSRNFGKEAALTAGIDYATGDAVIPIDADLQDPPELITDMVTKWKEGFDVVLATRNKRDESWLKKKSARFFYKLMSKMSHTNIPEDTGDFRLMSRKVIEQVNKLRERTRFMKGILSWPGFKTTTIYFDRPERKAGVTSWNYWKLWKFALDGIFSFTTMPLRVWTYIGAIISFFAFVYGSIIILKSILFDADVPGYPSLMVVILFLGGIQLLSLGIIGEYVARIYRETKNRPIYVVDDTKNI